MNLRLTCLSLAVATLLPVFAGAAPVPASSSITAVTVYGRGALVTREAEVTLEAGMQEIVFSGLPESLDPDLMQVSGAGSAQATILDVTAAPAQRETPANARLQDLRAQARSIQAELRTIDDRGQVLIAQQDYYDRIKQATVTPATGQDNTPALPPPSVWEQFITFYTDGVSKILLARQELEQKREQVQARLDAVNRQIETLDAPESRSVTNVTVRVNVATAGSLGLKLAYPVNAAYWRPTYDVRIGSADKSIRLDYAATVSQSTGEDWTDVALVLSTAQPNRSGTPPELDPWFVEPHTPMPLATAAPAAAMERKAMEAEQRARLARREDADTAKIHAMQVAAASVEAGLNAASFAIPYAANIPADNAAHKVTITSAPLNGEITHVAVPKLAKLAYLQAAVTNTTEFPLIRGEIALFLDGNFVGRSMIRTVAPTETFELNLGVDDAMTVDRKVLNRLREDTGLISKRVKTTYHVVTTVQNNRKTAEKLTVKDQIPVSRDEKILVTLLEPPAREIKQEADGTIRWTMDLKPGEKRELTLKFSIEHPADLPVNGLE